MAIESLMMTTALETVVSSTSERVMQIVRGSKEERALRRVYENAIDSVARQFGGDAASPQYRHCEEVLAAFLTKGGNEVFVKHMIAPYEWSHQEIGDVLSETNYEWTYLQFDLENAVHLLYVRVLENIRQVGAGHDDLHALATTIRLEAIAEDVRKPWFSYQQIAGACRTRTNHLASRWTPDHTKIERVKLTKAFTEFQSGAARFFIVTGPSGTGKSALLAKLATNIAQQDGIAVLNAAAFFDLKVIGEEIAHRLGGGNADWRKLLFASLAGEGSRSRKGTYLFIDALDEAEQRELKKQLYTFASEMANGSDAQIRVVMSSTADYWSIEQAEILKALGVDKVREKLVVEEHLTDFDQIELNDVLRQIGAIYLVDVMQPNGRIDPAVAAIRELLSHPATFGLFATEWGSGLGASASDITWFNITKRHVASALERAAHSLGCRVDYLEGLLVKLVALMSQSRGRDFSLSLASVSASLSELDVKTTDPTRSPFAALQLHRVLQLTSLGEDDRAIAFYRSDVGDYFLGRAMAKEAGVLRGKNFRDWLSDQVDSRSPRRRVVHGLIAWAYEMVEANVSQRFRDLVHFLASNRTVRQEVAFRLVPPQAAEVLLTLLADSELDPYVARRAMLALPPSSIAMGIARKKLSNPLDDASELAVRAVGRWWDRDSINQLAALTVQASIDQRSVIIDALARIGNRYPENLLQAFHDGTTPTEGRRAVMIALRGVDIPPMLVEAAVKEGLESADNELRDITLLTGAALHVPAVIPTALERLGKPFSDETMVALYALTQMPNSETIPALKSMLFNILSDEEATSLYDFGVVRQVATALRACDSHDNFEWLRSPIKASLERTGGVSTVGAIGVVERLVSPQLFVSLGEALLMEAKVGAFTERSFHLIHALNRIRDVETLDALEKTFQQSSNSGFDFAQVICDHIVEGQSETVRAERREHFFLDPNQCIETLRLLVKLGVPNLESALAAMLNRTDWPVDQTVADLLLMLGDPTLEAPVLEKCQAREVSGPAQARRTDAPLFALATCGGNASADFVLDYIRAAPEMEVDYDFGANVVAPLAERRVISVETLTTLLADSECSEIGKIALLLALDSLRQLPSSHELRFALGQAQTPALKGYLLRAFTSKGDDEDILVVEQYLKDEDTWVSANAAAALTVFGSQTSQRRISDTYEAHLESGTAHIYLDAIANCEAVEAIPVLREFIARSRFPHVQRDAVMSLARFIDDAGARETVLESLYSSSGGFDDRGQQEAALMGLARFSPDDFLRQVAEMLRSGDLEPSGRQVVTQRLVDVQKVADTGLFESVLRHLLTDRDEWVRTCTVRIMAYLDATMCETTVRHLLASEEAWDVVCGVESLGGWAPTRSSIEEWLSDGTRSIREAAKRALATFDRRIETKAHLNRLRSGSKHQIASSILCLEELATYADLSPLGEVPGSNRLLGILTEPVSNRVSVRMRNEHREIGRRNDDPDAGRTRIVFD